MASHPSAGSMSTGTTCSSRFGACSRAAFRQPGGGSARSASPNSPESFIRAEPPARPQLFGYGAGFPAFLERSIEAAALPWLADVARLEWAREEAYYATDAAPLALTALASIPVERYPELRFEPHPSLRLICSAGPIFTLWQAALDAATEESAAAVFERSGPSRCWWSGPRWP